MILQTRPWLGLILSLLLIGCSPLLTDTQNAPERESERPRKSALVVSETHALAKAQVLAAGGIITHNLPLLNAVGAVLSPQSIQELSENQQIENIIIDVAKSDEESHEYAITTHAADWLISERGAPVQNHWLETLVAGDEHDLTGQGIGLAIVDTGIAKNATWGEPSPRIIARYNSITDIEGGDVSDNTGHGTHISSLIVGAGSNWAGIAPLAPLVIVKAFDAQESAQFLDVIRAVQWVTVNKERLGIRVLNLSISASTELPYNLDPLNRALTAAWDAGLVVVVSAGNLGPHPSAVTAPGNNPWLITVGAASFDNSASEIRVAPFSGRGPTHSGHIKPNIVAPGTRLAAFLPPTASRPSHEPTELTKDGLWVTSGASQASAVVAGLITLLLEARPELSNNDVKCLLANTARPLVTKSQTRISPMSQGRGLIDISAALRSTDTDCEERFEGLSPGTVIEGAYPLDAQK